MGTSKRFELKPGYVAAGESLGQSLGNLLERGLVGYVGIGDVVYRCGFGRYGATRG